MLVRLVLKEDGLNFFKTVLGFVVVSPTVYL